MEADIYSLFCYATAMSLSMLFAWIYEQKKRNRIRYFILSYLTIVIFCGFRFFVGNDYFGYYSLFNNISRYKDYWYLFSEPGYALLNYIFRGSKIGYFFVLFISTIITYYFIFNTLRRLEILKWGIFAIFTLGFLIIANDQVRQGIAMSIFLFSIQYIKKREVFKFVMFIGFATLFHYSAIITICAYPISKLKIKPICAVLFLVLAFIIKISGTAESILHSVTSYASLFNESYGEKALDERYFSGASFGFQLLYFFIISLFIQIGYNSKNTDEYYTLFAIGAPLYMLFWGQMLFERISLYFFETIILVLPPLLYKKNIKKLIIISICSVYFILQSLFALEKNGAIPYRTIYDENLINPPYNKDAQVK